MRQDSYYKYFDVKWVVIEYDVISVGGRMTDRGVTIGACTKEMLL